MQSRDLNEFRCINAALEAEDELGWHMNEMVASFIRLRIQYSDKRHEISRSKAFGQILIVYLEKDFKR